MTETTERYTTDWINTRPVFYNTKTGRVSATMDGAVDWGDFAFDPEGLHNYLTFGYQVFERTAVRDVRMLPHSSTLERRIGPDGGATVNVMRHEDPTERYAGRSTTEEEAMETLRDHVRAFERSAPPSARFLLPLSGGYDSRMLGHLIGDRSRIDAVTYDISLSGEFSFETLRARETARRLGCSWSRIEMDRYWGKEYLRKNFEAFLLEMPVHASFHMEMYETLARTRTAPAIVLSGSVGDWWSGDKVPLRVPSGHRDFGALFFNHGISMPDPFITVRTDHAEKRAVFERDGRRLAEDATFRTLFARRGRMGLATYIYRTAAMYFETYTPFYDIDVAMSQLQLPAERRSGRRWLSEYLQRAGLGLERTGERNFAESEDNALDLKTAYRSLEADDLLSPAAFDGIVRRERIEWINRRLSRVRSIPLPFLAAVSRWGYRTDRRFRAAGIPTVFGRGVDYLYCRAFRTRETIKALSEWTLLKPLQMALEKANGGRGV